MTARPARQPAARPELPKAPSTGHPARRLPEDDPAPDTATSVSAPRARPVIDDPRVNFGARVRESVRRRARVWAVQNDLELQDLLDAALDEYLRNRGA